MNQRMMMELLTPFPGRFTLKPLVLPRYTSSATMGLLNYEALIKLHRLQLSICYLVCTLHGALV